MTATTDRARLRELLGERSAPFAPGVFDGLSASLTRAAGFRAGYMSGAAVAATLGLPDVGLATQTEMASRAALITRVLGVPLIADADTGFGDATHTHLTVRLYEQAGVAGIQLEDQEFPKRCGHLADKHVIPAADFAAKIEAAAEARSDPGTVIIARTDARAPLGFDEAVRRVNLYAEAGADMVFLEAPQTVPEIMAVPSAVKVPALFNLVPRGKTPPVTAAQLREAGYALVILPVLNIGSAASAMRAALERAGAGDVSTDGQDSPRELFDSVGLDFWEDLRARHERPAR
ncbi:MAG TPA: isocitrate lyase/PEP mutase family protein [Trebonia sp.]|jgi:2-methylisocitrate lyase-like PEP mutase family enzyme|nr:isocitrate lyase/PEP mutase family protein [Trebonia sp.]